MTTTRHYDCEGTLQDLELLVKERGLGTFSTGDTASAPPVGMPESYRALWRCTVDEGEGTVEWSKIGPWSRADSTRLADAADEIVTVSRRARTLTRKPSTESRRTAVGT